MKQPRSIHLPILLAVALAVPAALAQGTPEGDEDETSKGGIIIEGGTWIAQPTGIELEPVTVLDPNDPFGTSPISYSDSTDTEIYFKLGYQLSKNYGRFVAYYYDHEQDDLAIGDSTPGNFQFGEILVNPLFAGVNLDGLADAWDSTAAISLTDFRLDYYRTAFENSRIKGEWFVGWRRVKFDRSMTANYYALVPGFTPLLPPLTDPIPSLDPRPDTALIESRFEGRGLSGGLLFTIPLIGDRLSMQAGFAYSALRGDIDASYASTTNYYTYEPNMNTEILLSAPYSAFGETIITNPQTGETAPLASFVDQKSLRNGMQVVGRSTSASIIDLNLELRWRAWRTLEFIFGFRNTRYDDVGLDLRSKQGLTPLGSTNVTYEATDSDGNTIMFESPQLLFNVQDLTEQNRSVTFEGFYLGIGYRL